MKLLTIVAVLAAALALAATGYAQEKPAKEKEKKAAPAKPAKKGTDATAGQKVLRIEAIKIEGKIQKPQAYYFLPRSNLNIEGLELNESFVPKIIKSVEEDPF